MSSAEVESSAGNLVVLLQTGRVAAEATVARLAAREIEAHVLDRPNGFVKLTSGGNYRVRVGVRAEELGRARAELARWELEAGPRLRSLTGEVSVGFALGSMPAAALAVWLLLREDKDTGLWLAVVPAWLVGLWAWAGWNRLRVTRAARAAGGGRDEGPSAQVPPQP